MRRASKRAEQAGLEKKNQGARARAKEEPPAVDLPTELAIGSDGLIYINAEEVAPEVIGGRKMFHGYALTPQEAEIAVQEIHRMAFNVTVAVRAETKGKKARRAR